jgi:methylase of polypeptide subunit release factors
MTTIDLRTDPPLELFISEKAFRPNPTTVRFARTVRVEPGDVVFDMGTGIGPLAIKAALDGARRVCGIDPVSLHCKLARLNVAKYALQDRVAIYQGECFEPFQLEPELAGVRADVIIGDVSGIAEPVARALGWYSDQVPTGGADGTEVLIDLIRTAPAYLSPRGTLYFPIAVDLSDGEKVLDAARACFAEVTNAMDRPVVQFPLSEQDLQAIDEAYCGRRPSYINVQPGRRPFWRGQIWKATSPVSVPEKAF